MHVGQLATMMHHLRRSSLVRDTTILTGIVGLIIFYILISYADLGRASSIQRITAASGGPISPWRLAWEDTFSGPAGDPPSQSKWTPDVGGNGWGSKQLQYYTDNQNVYLDGKGSLILEARKEDTGKFGCWYGPCQYTSARISTRDHFSFTYGLLEARIKIPHGQGLWPAFWLLGSNYESVGWPACGEIDVMENIGQKKPATLYGSVHGPENFINSYTLPHGTFADDFHVFALQWEPDHLTFFMDGISYATINKATFTKRQDWIYDHPFNIILNVSVGSAWPGNPNSTTVFPQKMYISYLKLYTKKS